MGDADLATQPPVLNAPVGVVADSIPVHFTLPENAEPGTVQLAFTGAAAVTLTLAASQESAGEHSFSLDPAHPANAPAIASLLGASTMPEGTYAVTLSYRDAFGNAVASTTSTNVRLDLTTLPPTLTAPASGALTRAPIAVELTLPEAAASGSVQLTFNGASAFALTLAASQETAGQHTFSFDPRNPTNSAAVASVSGGTAIPDGTYAVTLSYRDGFNHPVATAASTSVAIDATPPAIEPPTGGFTPTIVLAGAHLADYASQAAITDAHTVEVVQTPAAGSTIVGTSQQITLTATDAAGNISTVNFTVTVTSPGLSHTVAFQPGTAAPGANGDTGLPADAVLATFNPPATDDAGDVAFVAKWTSNDGRTKGVGLFLNHTCLGVVGGDASAVGGPGATWKSFSDPVVSDGHAVCIAALTGVPKAAASVVVGNLTGAALEKIARSGEAAAGASVGGATFKSFKAVTVQPLARVAFLAQLTAGTGNPKVSAANDTGIWYFEPGNPLLVMREGDIVSGHTIKTLVAFTPGNGSPGCGRGTLVNGTVRNDPIVTALALFKEGKSQGIIEQDVDDGAPSRALSLSADNATGLDAGGAFASYSLPARNDGETVAFLGKLAAGSGVTSADATGIFIGPDTGGKFMTVVRTGSSAAPAGQGAKFQSLKDPVLSDRGDVAFAATLQGVKGLAAQTLWWKPAGQPLQLLAQGGARPGNDLPADAQWKSFTSLAIAGGARGPIFSGTLVPGKGGVLKTETSGVWATDFTGAVWLLFQTGDEIGGKKLKSFTLLNASVGSTGVTRSFNNAAKVVWLATFDDKTQAIVTTEVP